LTSKPAHFLKALSLFWYNYLGHLLLLVFGSSFPVGRGFAPPLFSSDGFRGFPAPAGSFQGVGPLQVFEQVYGTESWAQEHSFDEGGKPFSSSQA
jgi:hypothetical protein